MQCLTCLGERDRNALEARISECARPDRVHVGSKAKVGQGNREIKRVGADGSYATSHREGGQCATVSKSRGADDVELPIDGDGGESMA